MSFKSTLTKKYDPTLATHVPYTDHIGWAGHVNNLCQVGMESGP